MFTPSKELAVLELGVFKQVGLLRNHPRRTSALCNDVSM
jgi:hypothetical protein